MRILGRLVCLISGHRWRARRFSYQGSYCEACERCWAQRDNHVWNGCRCEKCGVPDEATAPAHQWQGCTCTACGLQRHHWARWNEGRKCRLCSEQFLSWPDYLKATIGKEYADDADFVLTVGEAIRQEVFRKYEKARDAFGVRRTKRTMLLYQALLIAETTEGHETPRLAHKPAVPAFTAAAQSVERESVRTERETRGTGERN